MTNQAFDSQNQAHYEENTKVIEQAIAQIKFTNSLKPSVAEVCRLTGFHRNSFKSDGPRGYVLDILKEIKEERRVRQELEKKKKKDQLKELEDQLDNAFKELVYWFGKADAVERDFNQLELRLTRQQENTEWYKNELQKEREKVKDLQRELEKTNELLREIK